jgi:quinol monooxygenase YgiN
VEIYCPCAGVGNRVGGSENDVIIELVSISVSGTKRQELGRAFASLVGPIEVQSGCLRCRLFQAWPNEDGLLLEARWENQEGLIRHLQSDTYKRILLLIELSASPPSLEFLTVVECRGLDLVETARTGSS